MVVSAGEGKVVGRWSQIASAFHRAMAVAGLLQG